MRGVSKPRAFDFAQGVIVEPDLNLDPDFAI